MQTKLTQLAHQLVQALIDYGHGYPGSVTVTDNVIKTVPALLQQKMGRSDCDTEKYASP